MDRDQIRQFLHGVFTGFNELETCMEPGTSAYHTELKDWPRFTLLSLLLTFGINWLFNYFQWDGPLETCSKDQCLKFIY
jgi:hypothetical protein